MAEQPTLDQDVTQLAEILEAQLHGHGQLLDLMSRNREAVRQADMTTIEAVCGRQNTVGQHLAELEKQRLMVVGRFTARLAPEAERPLTVGEIAAGLEPPAAQRLEALADALRPAVERVREESSLVRQAAEALAGHMTGIMHAVHAVLSGAQVYGRTGEIAGGAPCRLCVDVTS